MDIEHVLDVAAESTDFEQRVGCIVTDKKGRVISSGFNKRKTHPLQYKHAVNINEDAIYLHAEIAALVKCRKKPHTIYVGRLTKGGRVGLAKPCPICMGAIIEAGVKVVHYTNDEGTVDSFMVDGE